MTVREDDNKKNMLVWVVLFCAGCAGTTGDLLSERRAAETDGSSDDDDVAAAETPDLGGGASCLPWTYETRFAPVEALAAINTPHQEIEPFVTPDGLHLFFSSDRPGGRGGLDIYVASRPTPDAPFGDITSFAAANTEGDDTGLFLSASGLTIYLSSNRPGGKGGPDIWTATRAVFDAPFAPGAFAPLEPVSGPGRDFDPALSVDGLRLYFVSDGIVSSGSMADVAVAERSTPTGSFGPPRPVVGINEADTRDGNPTLSADELLIVFSSNRGGSGSPDIWYATRPDRSAPFDPPRPLATVNSPDLEGETFLTADGCTLYFSRKTDGQHDLYRTRVVLESEGIE